MKEKEKESRDKPTPEEQRIMDAAQRAQSAFLDNPMLSDEYERWVDERVRSIEGNEPSIGDFLVGRVRQRVPVSDDLEVVFQTLRGGEDLAILEILREDAIDQLDLYMRSYWDLLRLAVSLDEIGGEAVVPKLDGLKGVELKEAIKKRLSTIVDLPLQLIWLLAVNFIWFDKRVREALSPGALKNG